MPAREKEIPAAREADGVKREMTRAQYAAFRHSSESEFFRSVTERSGQCAQAAKAQVNGAAPMPHCHVHDGMERPAVIALLPFARIEMNKHPVSPLD
jgi:hypothetical protein